MRRAAVTEAPEVRKAPKRLIPRPEHGRLDVEGIVESFATHMMYSVAKDEHTASDFDVYQGLALAVWDRLMERWFATQGAYYRSDAKRVYYLSMEFLIGRTLLHNILNLGAHDAYREAMAELGYDLAALEEQEWDAGLGNGGLGRLAACFLDSAATLALPFYGYGIRYEYGIFTQRIQDGWQVEAPDNWLRYRNPWEIPRPDALYPVDFYGRVQRSRDAQGRDRVQWVDTQGVMAMAYDTPVAGYRNDTVNTLRLWAAKSTREFDLARFNAGEYVRAVEDKDRSESISKVLYPPDDQYAGKELRLRQQYFFVSATLQDILRRFRKAHADWRHLPDKVAVQLNDTHPAIAIAELMRILHDWEGLDWSSAWSITERVFAYTNHTILPEALERWPAELLGRLLPRHLEIIEEIDRRFRVAVSLRYPGDGAKLGRMAIIGDDPVPTVRMAHLAIVGSHAVNGVARLHTEILKGTVFPDFDAFFPGRFSNKTNGIAPRRWLLKCNPGLAALITEAIGDRWVTDLDALRALLPLAEDAGFRARWAAVKRANKIALAAAVGATGLPLDPDTLFDCQVKRIHEYKRQLLNVLRVVALYDRLRDGAAAGQPPRTVIFAGKAAPGYAFAKLVIKLIHAVAARVNGDPATAGRLRVAFLPNYGVSAAERIFPATELSEQISTAGTEASGTGNMKAILNGALIIGTLDGANVEIRDAVGAENFFTFGHTATEIADLRRRGYDPRAWADGNPELARVIHAIGRGEFEPGNPGLFQPVVDVLLGGDRYFHCADFASYLECQTRVGEAYGRPDDWIRMSIRNVANTGAFSSDRTVREYARDVWGVEPVPVSFARSPGGAR
ncbi:MAG: glycogen/starch/alpha-glucan phosphorylase [Candidatus Rokubacteria bacterium]|nr:glycogen/starch/alpha-glucan phosphorylase [Candidatus Rokubacteria bacterium]